MAWAAKGSDVFAGTALVLGLSALVIGAVLVVWVTFRRRNAIAAFAGRRGLRALSERAPLPTALRWLLPDQGRGRTSDAYVGRWDRRAILIGRYRYVPSTADRFRHGDRFGKSREFVVWVTAVEVGGERRAHRKSTRNDPISWALYDNQLLNAKPCWSKMPPSVRQLQARLEALNWVADRIEAGEPTRSTD